MHEPDMITAFNDCVERVLAGEPVERVLQDYPTLAGVLRPMVETALSVRRSAPPVPVAAKARVGARVMQAADRLGYVQHPRHRVLPRLTWAAAALVAILFAGLLSLWLRSRPENAAAPSATPAVTVIATGTASVTPTVTTSATPSIIPTLTPSVTPTSSPTIAPCTFVIGVPSANLRSGPGTGYPVVGTASQGERLRVLAQHVSGTWYEVQRTDPPLQAWVSASLGTLEGTCDNLPTSDLPLLSGDGTSGGSGTSGGGGGSWMPSTTPDMGGMHGGGMFGGHDGGDDDGHDGSEHDGGFDDHMPDF